MVRQKRGENDVTSCQVSDVISGHVISDVIFGEVISGDVTSGRKKYYVTKMKILEKIRENDTRKMTSCTRKTSNVAFQTLRFEKVR